MKYCVPDRRQQHLYSGFLIQEKIIQNTIARKPSHNERWSNTNRSMQLCISRREDEIWVDIVGNWRLEPNRKYS
jgi:hypothetical protein